MAKRSQSKQQNPPRRGPELSNPVQTRARPRPWFVAILLAISIGALYAPALHAPFIFDDRTGIVENDSIYKLWPLIGSAGTHGPLNPGPDLPSSPRPLTNLSLAVNYFFGGVDPFGYHIFSVVLHILTALLLWALVRNTLLLAYFKHRFDKTASWLALAVAMLWALHPLVTETVIYATQRSEQLMAFFYLATLYCSQRYWLAASDAEKSENSNTVHKASPRMVWLAAAVLACFAGMASKEVMVSAPLLVLLYDRVFIAGSLAKALRQSWPLYLGLAASWLLLLVVTVRAPYGTAAGFGVGVSAYQYWLTQTKVILVYLKLCFWPAPLQIHYEFPYFTTLAESWMYVLPVFVLGGITLVLLWRNHPAGLLGTLVFAVLAPTSVIPIRLEMAAERRMYFPLAALLILAIVGIYWLVQRMREPTTDERKVVSQPNHWGIAFAVILLIATTFFVASAKRLRVYSDEMALWQDVLKYQPHNIIAHNNVGLILTNAGRLDESIKELQATLAIKPGRGLARVCTGLLNSGPRRGGFCCLLWDRFAMPAVAEKSCQYVV